MILKRMNEFDSTHQAGLEQYNVYGFGVFSDLVAGVMSDTTEEKIGTVSDVLVDEAGQLQYLVIDLGLPVVGRQVLLASDRVRVDQKHNRVYATGITREQAASLPEYSAEALRSQAR
jgi:PRC-barrel domain